jgi:excisionase family DNA binding protein
MMNSETLLLTPTDVAKRLQVSERTVTQWLRKGLLRGHKIGKQWRISADDLGTSPESAANKPFKAENVSVGDAAESAGLPGTSDMFRSLKDPDQQPNLSKADRLFVLAMNGQRFEDISREEAKRLRQQRDDGLPVPDKS